LKFDYHNQVLGKHKQRSQGATHGHTFSPKKTGKTVGKGESDIPGATGEKLQMAKTFAKRSPHQTGNREKRKRSPERKQKASAHTVKTVAKKPKREYIRIFRANEARPQTKKFL